MVTPLYMSPEFRPRVELLATTASREPKSRLFSDIVRAKYAVASNIQPCGFRQKPLHFPVGISDASGRETCIGKGTPAVDSGV